MNNVLVIGGSGFIGGHLAEKLCLRGYKVAVLVRKNSDTKFLKLLGVELRLGNLLEPYSLKEAFSEIDTVFCVVNVKPVGKSQKDYKEQLSRLHAEGTRNLIKACKINNVRRLIYFSSVAAIGYRKGVNSYDESSEENPIEAYGKAKLEAENILKETSKNREMDITILRPPGVFGKKGRGPLKKIIFFVEKRCVPIIGRGENKQSLTYVGNVVNQAIFVAENPNAIGKTYITSDDRPYSVNELVNMVAKVMNICPLKIHVPTWLVIFCVSVLNSFGKLFFRREIINKESFVAITSERIFDGSRIFRELGYKQEYDLTTGITRTIEWYKKSKNE
ncbi:MAG TPA: NAD(P)-dependent oxidoreductase [Candidatus Scalindua sp.]|nr:NAD(P)-dependent oxidoreductase [Candidatus Scalindua sp.]